MVTAESAIEQLLVHCRFGAATAALGKRYSKQQRSDATFQRFSNGVYALAGDDHTLARHAEPPLLACRTGSDIAAYIAGMPGGAYSYDYLCAAIVSAWNGDAESTYSCLRETHDRAVGEERQYLAVGARRQLAHHALLFGDVAVARGAIDEAIVLAAAHGLGSWLIRCTVAAAQMALDCGDAEYAAALVAQAEPGRPEDLVLLAPVRVQLALSSEERAPLRNWPEKLIDTALYGNSGEALVAATVAGLLANGSVPPPGSPLETALRRAILQSENVTNSIELFTAAARYGDLDEARFAAEALRAVVAPDRAYVKAHALLARAYLLVRCGERSSSVDHAGDAARAFNTMGLRRWTNEAMLLLVHEEGDADPLQTRRTAGTFLTEREQQVAHLIRRGARNREVAQALGISEHTVERHVSSILSRLGLRSRWQLVEPAESAES